MDKLKELFYNPKTGLVNSDKLYKKTKELNLNLSRKQVDEWYKKQSINQIMKPIRKEKHYSSVVANYPGEEYQMDIIVYNRYTNHNYKYILVIIDIYSRYMQCRAMTNRELPTIIKNFKDMINDMNPPYKLSCDNEFNKREFLKVLDNFDIKYKFTDPNQPHKNSIVERANGTIANMLQKIRITTKKYDWYNYLDDVTENYNNTVHSTTKNKPIDIWNGKEFNEQKTKVIKHSITTGDKVRILTTKKVFDKGDIIKSSKEIYIVENTDNNRIKLIDDPKRYKPYELQKITDSDENDNIEIPVTETKENKQRQELKRLNVDSQNIISYGRVRTKNKKYL